MSTMNRDIPTLSRSTEDSDEALYPFIPPEILRFMRDFLFFIDSLACGVGII